MKEINKHIAFFSNIKNYHLDAANRLFVHAGFTNFEWNMNIFPNYFIGIEPCGNSSCIRSSNG